MARGMPQTPRHPTSDEGANHKTLLRLRPGRWQWRLASGAYAFVFRLRPSLDVPPLAPKRQVPARCDGPGTGAGIVATGISGVLLRMKKSYCCSRGYKQFLQGKRWLKCPTREGGAPYASLRS